MILDVRERIILLDILPALGDFSTLKIVRKLREELSFNEEEHKKLGFKTLPGEITAWNAENEPNKDIQIGEKANDIIVSSLKKLNDEKMLKQDHFSLYEKFVENKTE